MRESWGSRPTVHIPTRPALGSDRGNRADRARWPHLAWGPGWPPHGDPIL